MRQATSPSRIDRSLRSGSRRRFIGLGVAASSALAVLRSGGTHAAQVETGDDVATLNSLLAIEYLEVALIDGALLEFDDADWRDAGAGRNIRIDLEEVLDQEQAHVAALVQAVADAGGTPVEPIAYGFGYADAADFLRVAAGIADTVVAAYAGALPLLSDPGPSTTAIGIHSVEARHAGFLALAAAESPFPEPIDQPLMREEVVAILAGYTSTDGRAENNGEGPEEPVEVARNVFAAVIANAADRAGIDPDDVEIIEATEEEWPTSALGCPEADGVYAQVITPGYRVLLDAAGTILEYHTGTSETFVLCD
jgi:hypothetical protein